MQHILTVTTPFFALVLLGWAVARWRVFPLTGISGLNVFVLYFALPCMLFRFSATTAITQLLDVSAVVVYLGSALTLVALATVRARQQRTGWSDAGFSALVAVFPNSGFMGVPLIVALLGQAAAAPAIVTLAVDMVITSSLCIAISQAGGAVGVGPDVVSAHPARAALLRALRGMLINPLPWAIALGTLSSAWDWLPPAPLMRSVDMLAGAASPVALFALGAMLARGQLEPPGPHAKGHGWMEFVAFKLLLHPLLVWVAGLMAIAAGLSLDPFAAAVLVLIAALPSASNVPIMAERFGADGQRLARVVLVSTVCAFASFSAAVAWMQGTYWMAQPAISPAH